MAIARGGGGLGVAAGTGVGSKVVPPFESPLAVSASLTGLASVARSGCSAPGVAAAMVASTICCPRAAAVNRSISGLNATHVAVASADEKVPPPFQRSTRCTTRSPWHRLRQAPVPVILGESKAMDIGSGASIFWNGAHALLRGDTIFGSTREYIGPLVL